MSWFPGSWSNACQNQKVWKSFNSKDCEKFSLECPYCTSSLSNKPLMELWKRKPSGSGCPRCRGFGHPWVAPAEVAFGGFPSGLFLWRASMPRDWAKEWGCWHGGVLGVVTKYFSTSRGFVSASGQKCLCGLGTVGVLGSAYLLPGLAGNETGSWGLQGLQEQLPPTSTWGLWL